MYTPGARILGAWIDRVPRFRRPAKPCLAAAALLLVSSVNARAAESSGSIVRPFGIADWAVLAVYAIALVGIGYYYSRRQSTSEEYFVAGRSLAPFLAGVSLYATMFSTLSYIGNPGETAQNGPILLCINLISLPAIYLIVGYLIIPPIMRLQVTLSLIHI